ncbi:hypothetical protein KDN24_06650 [Bacillus sp. Bva_UNVM-123]|uniref:hypothetical protein n=1 Tax=Bacillus sp. Bva_UNVM-123 TaxID=2829798 RepID=UPI00391F0E1C
MSKISESLSSLSSYNFTMSVDEIFNNFTIREIKEYVIELQNGNKLKEGEIKRLITENVKLEVKLESSR